MNDDRVRKLRTADALFWLKKEKWSPAEAAVILAGYEPELFPDGSSSFCDLEEDADGIHRLIIESINSKEVGVANTPDEWVKWAQGKTIPIPAGLAARMKESPNDDGHKIDKRIVDIVNTAKQLGYNPMCIPWGGKKIIKNKCLEELRTTHHGFTDTTFDQAWKKASKNGEIAVEDKKKYIG